MNHPIARIFAPILVIVGIAASTVAFAGHHAMKKEAMSGIVENGTRLLDQDFRRLAADPAPTRRNKIAKKTLQISR